MSRVSRNGFGKFLMCLSLSPFALLIFGSVLPTANAQTTSPQDAAILAGFSGDARYQPDANERYEAAAAKLLELERFDELEKIANTARSEKQRFSAGIWKLYILYNGLRIPATENLTEANWTAHIERLHKWVQLKPESITARIALATAYIAYSEDARGDGYANTVTEEGWRLQKERLAKAQEILEQASSLQPKCPQWFYIMQELAFNQGWSLERENELLNKAIEFEPTYYPYYRLHAKYLQPKWYGEPGDSEDFAEQISNRIGGKLGDVIYFETSAALSCGRCGDKFHLELLSWNKVKEGYDAQEEMYGFSIYKLNQLASLAVAVADGPYARKLFDKIGENWDKTTWGSKQFFDENKAFVAEMPENNYLRVMEAAKTNLLTPEGKVYHAGFEKEFAEKVGPGLKECLKAVGPEESRNIIMLNLNKDGLVQGGFSIPSMSVSNCVGPLIMQKLFNPPPGDKYWIRIDTR